MTKKTRRLGNAKPWGADGERRTSLKRSVGRSAIKLISCLSQIVFFVFLAPWRLLRAIRYSMTTASVSLLLVGIMTLNIIWGYPWTGMFAASISLMCVGLLANYWMRPRLRIDFSLPSLTPAGQPCNIVAHGTNIGRIPAFDFSLGLRSASEPRRKRTKGKEAETLIETSPAVYFGVARPGERIDMASLVVFHRRGIQTLPDVVVTTTFPFHLFRCRQFIESSATIAVTPRPLVGDDDATSRALLHAIGGWSHRLLSGDALDYTGSREYQLGMPVRRWDFASWARLGRPIVREYQSPSMQSVFLLVDTGVSNEHSVDQSNELMERALSLASAAIIDSIGKSIRIQLYVTSESPSKQRGQENVRASATDGESLQIRLAQAESTESTTADERIRQVLSEASGGPTLLITPRRHADAIEDLNVAIDVICVDQGEQYGDLATPVNYGSKNAQIRLHPSHDDRTSKPALNGKRPIAVYGSP